MGINQLSKYISDPDIDIITGACPHDCPDTCSWQVAVSKTSGQAVDIWGHPDHPVTAGMLCTKVDHYLERTYHRDRLTTPLKRIGPKGSGEFKPVSWDEALNFTVEALKRTKQDSGADAIGVLASAKCTNEENYLLQKLTRAGIGTNNIDHCARL